MADGKNLLLGWVGKIRSFFSADYGPMIGLAIGASLGAITKIVGGLIGPIITGLFARTEIFLDDGIVSFSDKLPSLFRPIGEFFEFTLPSIFSGGSVSEGISAFFEDMSMTYGKVFADIGKAIKHPINNIIKPAIESLKGLFTTGFSSIKTAVGGFVS